MLQSRQSTAWNRTRRIACETRPCVAPQRPCATVLRAAFLLASIALTSPAAAALPSLIAFGNAIVAIPSSSPTGTIVARQYFTPQEFCGASTCTISSATLSHKGHFVTGGTLGPDLETNVSGLSTRMLIDGVPVTQSISTTLRNMVEVQLFRDSRTPTNGSLNSGSFSLYYQIWGPGWIPQATVVRLSAQVNFINGTCSVPDQAVTLPSVQRSAFNGVGSTTGTVDFQLRLNNCPAGYNRIGYQLSPLDGAVAGSPGTLKLRPESTAAGIGIQIADGVTSAPLPLQQSITVTGYNKNTGGSPSIPLRASYIQTDATIKGGSVRAAAQVLLDYQ
ncbi:fimbrial protein [Burkholderia ubonensis]|uniref:fimbrial protein n=1 Tax=Burkholderia ubonensis TaxID=101571 RepID=UPI0009B49AE7|nr:fimbrial protein [Burkholderia ubonensis]